MTRLFALAQGRPLAGTGIWKILVVYINFVPRAGGWLSNVCTPNYIIFKYNKMSVIEFTSSTENLNENPN